MTDHYHTITTLWCIAGMIIAGLGGNLIISGMCIFVGGITLIGGIKQGRFSLRDRYSPKRRGERT